MDKKNTFTVSYDYLEIVDELYLDINVSTLNGNKKVRAIIDTGATCSVISKALIDELRPRNSYITKEVNGRTSDGYFFDIYLSEKFLLENFILYRMPPYLNEEFLIGMDIISLGDLAISNYENQTSITFRIPSEQKINFHNI
jgi:predicted aspartyl protease